MSDNDVKQQIEQLSEEFNSNTSDYLNVIESQMAHNFDLLEQPSRYIGKSNFERFFLPLFLGKLEKEETKKRLDNWINIIAGSIVNKVGIVADNEVIDNNYNPFPKVLATVPPLSDTASTNIMLRTDNIYSKMLDQNLALSSNIHNRAEDKLNAFFISMLVNAGVDTDSLTKQWMDLFEFFGIDTSTKNEDNKGQSSNSDTENLSDLL